jgi:putative ABC transport system ATP-binding protein
VICVTHDPRLEAFADRVIHLEDGQILDDRRASPASPHHAVVAPQQPELVGA